MKNLIIKTIIIASVATLPIFAESQGELRSVKNIHISILKLKGHGIYSEYFLNSNFSLGLGFEMSQIYQNQAIWGTSINAIYYANEVRDYRRDNLYFSASYFPFNSLGLYLTGKIGQTTGSSMEMRNRLLFGFNGDVQAASPKEQYGYKIEDSPRGYIGTGFGYKQIFSSGIFFGGEVDFNFYPRQRVTQKYSIYPDASTLLPQAKLDVVDYLYLRQASLDFYNQQKGFFQVKLFFGIAF